MQELISTVLKQQRRAWNSGHTNYGASVDVKAEAVAVLGKFKHLNPAQTALFAELKALDELKYAYRLSSAARNIVHQFVIKLK